MAANPWWIARVTALLAPADVRALDLGALWRLRERLQFVRLNVDPALLGDDLAAVPGSAAAWAAFGRREAQVLAALALAGGRVADRLRSGSLGHAAFRAHWEELGFAPHAEGAGTPADDFLDGMFHVSRLAVDEARAAFAMLNLASRAERVADFLGVTQPQADDVVFDLGSGSGKLALTVAASTAARVRGVELVGAYVDEASRCAAHLGLGNSDFVQADVRELDLSQGTIFYLYYPFHGRVAQAVAQTLGRLGRAGDITIYASGPANDYGEFFLAEVEQGALRLVERRGEFGEVMVLRGVPSPRNRGEGQGEGDVVVRPRATVLAANADQTRHSTRPLTPTLSPSPGRGGYWRRSRSSSS